MSKRDNKDLAERIVSQLGSCVKLEDGRYRADVDIIPLFPEVNETEKKARNTLAAQIASELNSGNLDLSDSWVEDNLAQKG